MKIRDAFLAMALGVLTGAWWGRPWIEGLAIVVIVVVSVMNLVGDLRRWSNKSKNRTQPDKDIA